ncbi:MAG: MBL fold metallo-hydrolase [Proteobacteria bacterium]|nr:MBL fold metallo-hydrolase [Pseudomonadota bacterium]
MPKVVFLGTNGWYDTDTGNTICILVDTPYYTIILDAGNGIAKLDGYVDFNKPAYLFLSHFHFDHIIGLHTICKYNFQQGLWICGQEGIASILGKMLDAPFTAPIQDFQFTTQFVELPLQKDRLPFSVVSLPLLHKSLTLGYRFEVDNKIIAFCGDTGYCDNAVKLAESSDLLITECAFQSGQENAYWPHLNPETAARIAKESGAKRLALAHFDAELYKTIEDRKNAQEVARKIFPDTIASVDDMVIEI